jgi:hypothetical protein
MSKIKFSLIIAWNAAGVMEMMNAIDVMAHMIDIAAILIGSTESRLTESMNTTMRKLLENRKMIPTVPSTSALKMLPKHDAMLYPMMSMIINAQRIAYRAFHFV